MLGYRNAKTFLLKDILKIGQEICFVIKDKNIVPWTYVISDFTGEPITGNFYEK